MCFSYLKWLTFKYASLAYWLSVVFIAAEYGSRVSFCVCHHCVCVSKCHVVILQRLWSRLSKCGTPYIWMHRETGYMVSIWLRRPLTKEPVQENDSRKLCGFTLHKAHPEGPTSSWNFKQSGTHAAAAAAAAPSLLEKWELFQVTYIFSVGDADWAVLVCGEYQAVAQNLFSSTDQHKEARQTLATGKVLSKKKKEPEYSS